MLNILNIINTSELYYVIWIQLYVEHFIYLLEFDRAQTLREEKKNKQTKLDPKLWFGFIPYLQRRVTEK